MTREEVLTELTPGNLTKPGESHSRYLLFWGRKRVGYEIRAYWLLSKREHPQLFVSRNRDRRKKDRVERRSRLDHAPAAWHPASRSPSPVLSTSCFRIRARRRSKFDDHR